jgi:hypothetical protein
MASFAAQHWRQLYRVPDRPASLYEGLAGAACLWLDLLVVAPGVREEEVGPDVLFPGYEVLLPRELCPAGGS